MRIYKEFTFEGAHYLPSAPEGHPNARIHGHSFRVRVSVDGEPDPETELLRAEQTRLFTRALARLAPRDRMIFRLRYQDALSLPDISAMVGLGLTTVKASLRKSRASLSAMVEEVAR